MSVIPGFGRELVDTVVGREVASADWSARVVGPVEGWPASLKSLVSMMLACPTPMYLAWGPELNSFYNDAYRPILGVRASSAMGRPFRELWGDIWDDIGPMVEATLAGEPQSVTDMKLDLARLGVPEESWWSFSYSPVRDEVGATVGLICVTAETSSRVLAERERDASEARLRSSEERLRALVNASSDVVYSMNVDWTELRQLDGRGFLANTDSPSEKWRDTYLPLEDRDAVHAAIEQAIKSKTAFEMEHRVRRADGGIGWIFSRAVPVLRSDGTIQEWFGMASDVTARREAETAAQASAEFSRRILESSTDCIKVLSLDAKLEFMSEGGMCVMEVDDYAQLDGAWWPDFWAGEGNEKVCKALTTARDGGIGRFEGSAPTAKGNVRLWDVAVSPINGPDERPEKLLAVSRDVTAQRSAEAALRELNETLEAKVEDRSRELMRAEDQLRQSQKLEAVGQLTGGVAHDFNNLLTIIRSSVDFLKREDLAPARRARYVEAISDTVERAAKLTSQLLAFARRQPLKPQVFDVNARVREVAELIRPLMGARIDIELEPSSTPCHAEADVSQFETALVNLAVNARDAMGGEGRLSIGVRQVGVVPAIRGHAGAEGDFLAVSVTDTGHGIAPNQIASIFEPFYTTKEVGKGTGLGLSQVFGFTKQSGGEVDVASKPGHGTVFTLYLPRAAAEAGSEMEGSGPERIAPMARLHVLVVEDNEAVGRFADEMLRDLGYVTCLVRDGRSALAALEGENAEFDVVFSDIVMPGMNGIDLACEIRRRRPGLPVVLTSGYSNILAQQGAHGFELLRKPYSVEELSRILRTVADDKRLAI